MVINDEDEDSNTALHLAALSGFSKTALALIKARANVEARYVHYGGFAHVLKHLECSRIYVLEFHYFAGISRKELHIVDRPTTSVNNPKASLTVCIAQNVTVEILSWKCSRK